MNTFQYINDYYGIAVTKGMHVEDGDGRRGVAVSGSNYVRVKIEGAKGTACYHPHALAYPALNYQGPEFLEVKARRAARAALAEVSPNGNGGAE
jgi:hypothetical protein